VFSKIGARWYPARNCGSKLVEHFYTRPDLTYAVVGWASGAPQASRWCLLPTLDAEGPRCARNYKAAGFPPRSVDSASGPRVEKISHLGHRTLDLKESKRLRSKRDVLDCAEIDCHVHVVRKRPRAPTGCCIAHAGSRGMAHRFMFGPWLPRAALSGDLEPLYCEQLRAHNRRVVGSMRPVSLGAGRAARINGETHP